MGDGTNIVLALRLNDMLLRTIFIHSEALIKRRLLNRNRKNRAIDMAMKEGPCQGSTPSSAASHSQSGSDSPPIAKGE